MSAADLEQVITVKARNGRLTVDELRQFLAEFDRAATPAPGPLPGRNGLELKARVGLGGGIRSITVTIPGPSHPQGDTR
jgi:hypothetical protein